METTTETIKKTNGSMKKHQAPAAPKKRNYKFIVILVLLIVGGGSFGISKYMHALHHEETDDAQVEANISPVVPRVTGYVKDVRVNDNQQVKKGDTLVVLDNRELQIRLDQTKAALATAESNLKVA